MSDKLHLRTEWMAMCKGLPAYKVAQILRRFPTGVNWTGANKGEMAVAWIRGEARCVREEHRGPLREALMKAPRVTPEEQKSRKARRNLDKRLRRLRSMMEVALEETEGADWLAQKLIDTGAASQEITMLLAGWKADIAELERKIEGIRKQISYTVQLEMAAQRALRIKQP